MKEQTKRPQEVKTPLYKKAIFPWAIILVTAVLFVGIVGGWTLREVVNSKVTAEAHTITASLK